MSAPFRVPPINLSHALGLCCMHTLRGGICTSRPFEELPCCNAHVPHWLATSFAHVRSFVEARAFRINSVNRLDAEVLVSVLKLRGAPLNPKKYPGPGFTCLHLDVDDASVLADIVATQGNDEAAARILKCVHDIGAPT